MMFQQLLAIPALFLAIPVFAATAAPAKTATATTTQPIVVELFTSQGCSSCPPADAYLGELSHNRPDVLPLAFHVTYWDNLGWKDPFSFDAATFRQTTYAKHFRNFPYTPEMVIEGRHSLIGSDRSAAEAAIEAAKSNAGATTTLSARQTGNHIAITVSAGTGRAHIMLVGYDPEHRTSIGRGENSGRTLTESNIVRSLEVVGEWTGAPLTLNTTVQVGERAAVILEAPDGTIAGAIRVGTTL